MKNKILYGWSLRRVLYLTLGVASIVYFIIAKEWWATMIGAYFAAMGLFNFGCAAGNCNYEPRRRYTPKRDEQPYEEIKAK